MVLCELSPRCQDRASRAAVLDAVTEMLAERGLAGGHDRRGVEALQGGAGHVNTIADQFDSHAMARLMPSLLEVSWRDPELAAHVPAFHEARRAPGREIIRDAKATGEIDPDIDPDVALAQLVGPLLFRRLILGERLGQDFREAIIRDFLAAHGTGRLDAEGSL
jgi:hypothetical protein